MSYSLIRPVKRDKLEMCNIPYSSRRIHPCQCSSFSGIIMAMGILMVGAARAEITPKKMGIRMGGHAVNRKARAVKDPLMSRALYLSDGHDEFVLVSLDLVGLMKHFVDRIRSRVPGIPPDHILVSSTHTHDSPDTIGYWGPMIFEIPLRSGLDPEYMEYMMNQAARSILMAKEAAVPARLRAARATAPAEGLTRNVREAGLKDDEVQILEFTGPRGDTIALVSNYPCHPEMLGHGNRLLSAEFLTPLHARLEARFGGVSLYFQNALGGMVTGALARNDGTFDPEVGETFNEVLAEGLAGVIIRGLEDGARPVEVERIRFAHREIRLPVDNWKFRLVARLRIIPIEAMDTRTWTVTSEANLLDLGEIRIATCPGEVLPALGFEIKHTLAAPFPLIVCLGCDELGYILPESSFSDPLYRYERSMSLGPGTGPALLEAVRAMVEEVSATLL